MTKKKDSMDIKQYVHNSKFVSVLKQVPIHRLDEVRTLAKNAAEMVEYLTSDKLTVRVRFRGPRYVNPLHTVKFDAEAFDVYVDTKLPARFSEKRKMEIANRNRKAVLENMLYLGAY